MHHRIFILPILFPLAFALALALKFPAASGAEKCLECHGNARALKALIQKKEVVRSAETSGEG